MKLKKKIQQIIWQKNWTEDQIHKYLGNFQRCYFSYAQDEVLRSNAASGGSITALMQYLMDTDKIDGALVCSTEINGGEVRPVFAIATTREELIRAQGSKYMAVLFASQAIPMIKAFEGRLAVVCLPCDSAILSQFLTRYPQYAEKAKLVITPFCGHNSEPVLTDALIKKLNTGHGNLIGFRHRIGQWRGKLRAEFIDGDEIRPFSYFSVYQNLYFFAQRKCHYCYDHTGYTSDISAGDIWSARMKANPIKHTCLITRTDRADQIVAGAIQEGYLHAQEESVTEVLDGQARTLPFHYNISARARVSHIFGEKIDPRPGEHVHWHETIAAFIVMFNERFSRSPAGRKLILSIPRPVLKVYLYILKGLESIG
jgi:coenzyme F420-reducing hydrogenase beta subunit